MFGVLLFKLKSLARPSWHKSGGVCTFGSNFGGAALVTAKHWLVYKRLHSWSSQESDYRACLVQPASKALSCKDLHFLMRSAEAEQIESHRACGAQAGVVSGDFRNASPPNLAIGLQLSVSKRFFSTHFKTLDSFFKSIPFFAMWKKTLSRENIKHLIWEDHADNKIPGLSSVEFRCLLLLEEIEINMPWLGIYLVSSPVSRDKAPLPVMQVLTHTVRQVRFTFSVCHFSFFNEWLWFAAATQEEKRHCSFSRKSASVQNLAVCIMPSK